MSASYSNAASFPDPEAIPLEAIPATLTRLVAIQGALLARLVTAQQEPSAPQPGLLTAAELARLLELPESWIRTAGRTGRLPVVKCGRYSRFNRDDCVAALASVNSK